MGLEKRERSALSMATYQVPNTELQRFEFGEDRWGRGSFVVVVMVL